MVMMIREMRQRKLISGNVWRYHSHDVTNSDSDNCIQIKPKLKNHITCISSLKPVKFTTP